MDEDGVRKLLQSLDLKARETGRSLNSVRTQVVAKEREKRINELTLSEIESLPVGGAQLYRGVGRMFVREEPAEIKRGLKAEHKEASETLNALKKKQKFLEGELTQTQNSVNSIFGRVQATG